MAGVPMRCVLKKPFMLSGCVGFPNKAFPPPDLCSPKRGAACPTEALHNRRGAGLRDRVRAAAYAVCRRRFAARRRGLAERKDVFAVCRGFRGIPQSRFAGAYACPPCVARAFSGPKRGGYGTSPHCRTGGGAHSRRGGPLCVRSGLRRRRLRVCGYWVRNADGRCCLRGMSFRRAGAGKMCSSDTALRENRKKGQPARDGGGISAAARSAAFALALGGFVYWPESTFASRQPSRLPMRKAGKKEIFRPCGGRCGTAAGG